MWTLTKLVLESGSQDVKDFGLYMNTTFFNYMFLSVGIGLSFAVGVGVSLSGQLNPVFTFAMAILGAQQWRNVVTLTCLCFS